MAVTATNALPVPYRIEGNKKKVVYDVAFDNKYLEGGETLAATSLGLNVFETAICDVKTVGGTVNVASAYYDGSLIHLRDETPAEVASEADVSGFVVRVTAWGV